jgi:hypothetical protein
MADGGCVTVFKGFFKRDASAPDWADFFEGDDFKVFVELIEVELRRLRIPFELGAGTVRVEFEGQTPQLLGLQNLAQLCHREPREAWPTTIADHFQNVLRSQQEGAEITALAADFARVRPLLKIRVYGGSPGGEALEKMVCRPLAEGLVATLVYDLPSSVCSVDRGATAAWGLDDDALFDLALQNVAREPAPSVRSVDLGGGAILTAVLGETFFTASQALRLQHFLDAPPPHGALVALPHRHCLLFHPIRDGRVIQAVNGIIPMAFGMFREGPGSISPSLYWWRAGQFTLLPSEMTEAHMTFTPPAAFVAVLEKLGSTRPRGPLN